MRKTPLVPPTQRGLYFVVSYLPATDTAPAEYILALCKRHKRAPLFYQHIDHDGSSSWQDLVAEPMAKLRAEYGIRYAAPVEFREVEF